MNWPASPVGIGPMLRKFKDHSGQTPRRSVRVKGVRSKQLFSLLHPPRELMIPKLSSSGESQDDAEPHSSTVHLFVSLCHSIKRILLDHRMDAAQRTKFQGVLRIPRCARIPTCD